MESWQAALERVVRHYYGSPGTRTPPEWVASAGSGTTATNAQCGDRVVVYSASTDDGAAVWFDVAGCAICRASAELAAKTLESVPATRERLSVAREMVRVLTMAGEHEDADERSGALALVTPHDDRDAFLALRHVPGRQRCGTLPWEALIAALAVPDSSSR
jgi:NifU-like protein involved in Fe-S cluster formation